MVLFFIELSTRKVEIACIATPANKLWMSQIGRNLTDAVDAILNGKRHLIHDRDALFTAEFLSMLAEVGVKSVKLPPRSPNVNAQLKEESFRAAISNFVAPYHSERNHQGLANRLISAEATLKTPARSSGASAWAAC